MKKHFYCIAIITLAFTSCKDTPDNASLSEAEAVIQEKAQKYGLEDSISFVIRKVAPSGKPTAKIENMEQFAAMAEGLFANYREGVTRRQNIEIWLNKLKHVKSMQEYYQVLESDPYQLKQHIEACGGMESYNRKKADRLTPKRYRVYMGADSILTFLKSAEDNGTYPGKLLFES